MKLMGIDYGSKRVGIALSDDSGTIATPYKVLLNTKELLAGVEKIVKEWKVEKIILGESRDFQGKENPIMKRIHVFKKELEETLKIPVEFKQEFLSSHQAEQLQGKNDMHDASAAAIILQSYLDSQ